MQTDQPATLLELPEPCLRAILEALDPISLSCLASVKNKLYQWAKQFPKHANRTVDQDRLDSMLQQLLKHGKAVASIELIGAQPDGWVKLRWLQLPPHQKLSRLHLSNLHLQLLPGDGFEGLRAAAGQLRIKQLRIWDCDVDDIKELTKFVLVLPKLQHLSVGYLQSNWRSINLSMGVVQRLKRLTCLEIGGLVCRTEHGAQASTALQPLSAMTGLIDLRVHAKWKGYMPSSGLGYDYDDDYGCDENFQLRASMLSKLQRLTRLDLSDTPYVEPEVLAGRNVLQHLRVSGCGVGDGGPAGIAQLLSQLDQLQRLTHLDLGQKLTQRDSCLQWRQVLEDNPPPAAFASLTASSKLRHLDLSWCTLPTGLWRHLFLIDKLLPQLTALVINDIRRAPPNNGGYLEAPNGTQLVSCCPNLQHLDMQGLQKSAGTSMLTALQGLSSLRTLLIDPARGTEMGGLFEVCKLTGLRRLDLRNCRGLPRGLLLQVTQLQQLTSLRLWGRPKQQMIFKAKVPGDEPVWQQVLLWHCNDHRNRRYNPALAQQAAATLAELILR